MPKAPAKRRIAHQQLLMWLIVGSVLLLSMAGTLWWTRVQTDPERVFWGMLEQSLRTNGVTVQSSQDNFGTNVQYTLQYNLGGGDNTAQSVTMVEQQDTKLTTEVIGTPDADYTRYVDIETTEVDSEGNPIDVSAIENVWAEAKHEGDTRGLLGEAALGLNMPLGALPVPIAHLAPQHRTALLDQMRRDNVYAVAYEDTRKQRVDGRLQHVYNVQIQMILYASLMKQFGTYVGLHELEHLDPNVHSGAAPIELEMTVDVRSRQIVAIELVTHSGTFTQTYSGYNVPARPVVPDDAIPAAELQRRLQEL